MNYFIVNYNKIIDIVKYDKRIFLKIKWLSRIDRLTCRGIIAISSGCQSFFILELL